MYISSREFEITSPNPFQTYGVVSGVNAQDTQPGKNQFGGNKLRTYSVCRFMPEKEMENGPFPFPRGFSVCKEYHLDAYISVVVVGVYLLSNPDALDKRLIKTTYFAKHVFTRKWSGCATESRNISSSIQSQSLLLYRMSGQVAATTTPDSKAL